MINLITLSLFIDINISIPFIIIGLIVNKYNINLMPLNWLIILNIRVILFIHCFSIK